MMRDIWNDLRYSGRLLRNTPRFTIAAVVSLALGIGGNALIFSVVYSSIFHPLPYPDADRLVVVWESKAGKGPSRAPAAPGNFPDWQRLNHVFEMMALGQAVSQPRTVTGQGLPERVEMQYATADLFAVLKAHAAIGRTFLDTAGQPGDPSVILSYGFWQRQFAGDAKVLGTSLSLGNSVRRIIGVMPREFQIAGTTPDIWTEISLKDPAMAQRQVRWLLALARLKSGVTMARAQAEMNSIAHRLALACPVTNKDWGVDLQPLEDVGKASLQRLLYPLFGAVTFVLLIACANVANLMVARASSRKKEIAVRTALGAGRARLMRQPVLETLILALLSGVGGVGLAKCGLTLFAAYAPPGYVFLKQASIGLPVFLFTLGVSLVAGTLIGAAAMFQVSGVDLIGALKEGGKGVTSAARMRARSVLAVVEVTLAFVLLVGAGLLAKTLVNLTRVSLGFEPDRVLTAQVELAGPGYIRNAPMREQDMRYIDPKVEAFYAELIQRVSNLPGVDSAGLGSWLPLGGWAPGARDRTFTIAGRATPSEGEMADADYTAVSGGYFRTMRGPLLAGRYMDEHDTLDAPWVAVINEAMAKRYWPNQDPVGQLLRFNIVTEERPRMVVGVVGNVRQDSPANEPMAEAYVSFMQQPAVSPGHGAQNRMRMTVVIRGADASVLAPGLRRAVANLDKSQPVFSIRSMNEVLTQSVAPSRFITLLLVTFAILAAVLAGLGIFALMSYNVADRFQEIGIRIALGANRRAVIRLVLSSGIKLSLIGIGLGALLATWLTGLLTGMLYGVKPLDASTFVLAGVLLVLAAVIASMQPASRAMRLDPIVTLRSE
jgi:putative ABC transport system permease protein